MIEFCLYKSMLQMQDDLEQTNFDVSVSGTTCCVAYIIGNNLYTSNIGDSRSILVSFDNIETLKVKQLTDDHKPENIKERNRIIKQGGKVQQNRDARGAFYGPQRIWAKNGIGPGLAMSRSLGDTISHNSGCSCEPDISHVPLS